MGNKGRTHSGLFGIVAGVACAIVMCLIGLAGLTQLVMLEKAGERGIDIFVPVLMVLSSLLGSQIAATATDKKQMISILLSVVSLVLVTVIGGLAMEGSFKNVLTHIGAMVLGGGISCVLCLKRPVKGTRRKKRYR